MASTPADELHNFIAGEGTVRGLPIPSDEDGDNWQGARGLPAFPSSLDLEKMFATSRVSVSYDAQKAYAPVFGETAAPMFLNTFVRGQVNSPVVFAAAERVIPAQEDAQPAFAVKASILHAMPAIVQKAHNVLCDADVTLKKTRNADNISLRMIHNAISILYRQSEMPVTPRCFRDAAMTMFGVRRHRSRSASREDGDAEEGELVDTLGAIYLGYEHIIIALRLRKTLLELPAHATYERDTERWTGDCVTAFARPVADAAGHPDELAIRTGIETGNSQRARKYTHVLNAEAVNDVVAGAYWAFLYNARIAVGWSAVGDYFAGPMQNDVEGDNGPQMLFSVLPYAEDNLWSYMSETTALLHDPPTLSGLRVVRSYLAQILVTLSASQRVARAVHYDLHGSNIRLQKVREGSPEYGGTVWRYTTPVGVSGSEEIYIPADDLGGYAVRIIDAGRARIDRPSSLGTDSTATFASLAGTPASREFDAEVDVRALVYDLVTYNLFFWIPHLARAQNMRTAGRELALDPLSVMVYEFIDVIEEMAGMSLWTNWQDGPYHNNNNASGFEMAIAKPASFMQYAYMRWNGTINEDVATKIRTHEFMFRRTDSRGAGTPQSVLATPFFRAYRTPSTSTSEDTTVVHVSDVNNATAAVAVLKGQPTEGPAHRVGASASVQDVPVDASADAGVTPSGSPVTSQSGTKRSRVE